MALVPKGTNLNNRSASDSSVTSFFNGERVYFDSTEGVKVVKLISGDWYVTREQDIMISTILGSCVSVCIRDPIAKVGGMNHFMLPGAETTVSEFSVGGRYGVYSMECLINDLLKAGANKQRFEIKVFGGGNVTGNTAQIGSGNARFIRKYLANEGYRIEKEDLEGPYPRRLQYFPDSGRVRMLLLRRSEDRSIAERETQIVKKMAATTHDGEAELF